MSALAEQGQHFAPEEVAQRWSVSVDHVYRLCRDRELQSFRSGRRRIVLGSSVMDYERRRLMEEGWADVVPLRRVK